jgi:hypothetical protein
MIERLKQGLLWIGLPLMAVSGAIYALLKQNQGLKQDLKNEKAERAVDIIKREISEAEKDAKDKEVEYATARDRYRDEHGGGE